MVMVHSATRATMAPMAATTGASRAPTTPTVRGNSATVFPSLSDIVIFRTLPSLMTFFTFSMMPSPLILNDSFLVASSI